MYFQESLIVKTSSRHSTTSGIPRPRGAWSKIRSRGSRSTTGLCMYLLMISSTRKTLKLYDDLLPIRRGLKVCTAREVLRGLINAKITPCMRIRRGGISLKRPTQSYNQSRSSLSWLRSLSRLMMMQPWWKMKSIRR